MISCSLWHFKYNPWSIQLTALVWSTVRKDSDVLVEVGLSSSSHLPSSSYTLSFWAGAVTCSDSCSIWPSLSFLAVDFFFFPTRKSISGQPHFPLCVSRLLMKQVKLNQRMQTVWRAKEVQGVDRIMETFHVEALWSKEVRVSTVSFILGSGLQFLSMFLKQIYLSTFVLLNLLKLWYKIWYFMWFGATSVTYTYTPNINRCTWACISQSSVQWLKVSPRFGSSSAAHFGIVPSLWSHVPVYHSLGVLRSQSR